MNWEDEEAWREKANCRGVDPRVFLYPALPGRTGFTKDNSVAQRICDECPVQAECLEASQVPNPLSDLSVRGLVLAPGIWAGKGEKERRRYFRERRKKEARA